MIRPKSAPLFAALLAACTSHDAVGPSPLRRAGATALTHAGGVWTTRQPMLTPRASSVSATVNGIVYVIGGISSTNTCSGVTTVEAYDPVTDSWSTRAPAPTARWNAAAAEFNGRIYVVGGDVGCGARTGALEEYDPATNSWTTRATIPTPRSALSLSSVAGVLVAAGGVGGPPDQILATVEAYNPLTNSWSTRASLPVERGTHTSEAVGGRLYVIGGFSQAGLLTSVEVYDPVADAWSAGPTAPRDFVYTASAVLGGRIHVAGGYHHADHAALDPVSSTWHTETPMSVARGNHSIESAGGALFAIGGYFAPTNSVTGAVERYAAAAPPPPPPPPPPPANPTTKDQCKDGGWVSFGFRNQGQCVRYVETGKDSR